MKKQTFREYLMLFLGLIMATLYLGFALFLSIWLIVDWSVTSISTKLLAMLMLGFLWFTNIFLHYNYLGERFFSKLELFEDRIKWSCVGYRSVTMFYDEMNFVGVGNMDREDVVPASIRGDEGTFVYFSKDPLISTYRHKITRLRVKKGFIRFKYSDKLAISLMAILPAAKQPEIRSFYNKMQNADRIRNQKKKRQKKKDKSCHIRPQARERNHLLVILFLFFAFTY